MARQILTPLVVCLVLFAGIILASPRFRRGILSDEADKLIRSGGRVDTNDIDELVRLVNNHSAQECLARVICELSSGSKQYKDGSRFAKALMRFRQSNNPKVARYVQAMNDGARFKNSNDCRKLNWFDMSCNHQTADVVSAGVKLLRAR